MPKFPNKVLFLVALFFSIGLFAQSENELSGLFRSGTVTTQKAVVKVPIKIWNDLILLKVRVNGNDATFMWDNGFSFSGIDNSVVLPYKFQPYEKLSETTGTDGNDVEVKLGLLLCPRLEIKGISVSNTPFVKLDLRTMTMTKDLKIEGVLGASVINKLNWKFNFDKNYVEISEKPFAVEDTDLMLQFKIFENNNHIMPVAFNGIETECLVDFGYNSDIIDVNTVNAKLFPMSRAAKTFGPNSVSVSGLAAIDTIYTISDNFTWELSGKALDVKPKISFTKANRRVKIGNKLFRNTYNVIINTCRDTVYALSARRKPVVAADKKSYGYGLYIIEGTFKIMSINANANTIDSDIKLLNEVVSINGKTPDDFEDSYALVQYQKKLRDRLKIMVLKFKDGKEISLTLQANMEYEFNDETGVW